MERYDENILLLNTPDTRTQKASVRRRVIFYFFPMTLTANNFHITSTGSVVFKTVYSIALNPGFSADLYSSLQLKFWIVDII